MRTLFGRSRRFLHATGHDGVQVAAAAGGPERITPMTEDEQNTSGLVSRLVQEYIGQFREITERLEGLARSRGGLPSVPGGFSLPGGLPLPGGLSAAQMTSISDSIAAQRSSIAALKAQLSAYDEQLATLEQILSPLVEWSRTWADLEQRLLRMGHRPTGEK